LTYASHFGLSESPFSITPDPRFLYMSVRHREALAHLLYGITGGGGFVQLTGEVGTGKTTICRYLLEQLPPDVDVALILNPKLTALELLASACDELRIDYPAGTTSLKVLVDALYRHLLGAHARARRTVLIIDEAQNLTVEVLEQIRLLTNLETPREKLLQIILIGQPELSQLLDQPALRQLAQRVTARYHLLPFSPPETRGYIAHRMEVAGQRSVTFTEAAMREVHRLSGGVPRLINVICDRALLGAYAHDLHRIEPGTIRTAASEVLGRTVRPRYVLPLAGGAAAIAVAALGVVGWTVLGDSGRARVNAPPPSSEAPARTAVLRPTDAGTGGAETRVPLQTTSATPAAPGLGQLLGDAALRGDRRTAFTTLYARWGVPLDGTAGVACEAARADGLECLFRTGTWTRLRRLGLPAIIELSGTTGVKQYAVVTALGSQAATLELGDRKLTLPLDDINPFWDGAFILLWKPPSPGVATIGPGARGRDIEWLRQRLAALDGQALAARRADVYDDALRERVIAFQRSRSLVPDGIAGEETLTHLQSALREWTGPQLTAPRG
jgi:general secretion pathway protein A